MELHVVGNVKAIFSMEIEAKIQLNVKMANGMVLKKSNAMVSTTLKA